MVRSAHVRHTASSNLSGMCTGFETLTRTLFLKLLCEASGLVVDIEED
jgi:hypothetical protein